MYTCFFCDTESFSFASLWSVFFSPLVISSHSSKATTNPRRVARVGGSSPHEQNALQRDQCSLITITIRSIIIVTNIKTSSQLNE